MQKRYNISIHKETMEKFKAKYKKVAGVPSNGYSGRIEELITKDLADGN